ncbi:hypothetical protein MAR_038472 [Mya arenaria]|uniref:THD domain-containing protein n=1 Tax=Mya arenaria TaxID=6604 RepID=A0ABY7FVC5_MYAAR|nr:hypothetical protein MAR_038472 [Mya arenaria]
MSPDKKYLVILSTGRYFLYSQVGTASQNKSHATDQRLLRSDLTQCWGKDKDYGRYTSYAGASVMLNKGDKIYVKVTQIELLSRGERSLTYFGLLKMG